MSAPEHNPVRSAASRRVLLTGAAAFVAGTGAAAIGWDQTDAQAATTSDLDWINVMSYGATGDGSTDDTSAIQAALNAAQTSSTTAQWRVVYFPAGNYRTSSALTVPPGVKIFGGPNERRPQNPFGSYTTMVDNVIIAPLPSFTDTAIMKIFDAQSGGYSSVVSEIVIEGIVLHGWAVPASVTFDGLLVYGQVQGLVLEKLSVFNVTGIAVNFAKNPAITTGPVAPFSARMRGVFMAPARTGCGFFGYSTTDSTFTDCEAIGCGGSYGWQFQGGGSNFLIGCRAENGAGYGFWFTKTPLAVSPSATLVGCHTDGNTNSGYLVDHATVITLSACVSEGEGAAYAGFDIQNATGIVTLTGCTTNLAASPSAYGLRVMNAATVAVEGGVYYGSTAGLYDGGGNTTVVKSPNVIELTGTYTSPTVKVNGVQSYQTSIAVPAGQALGTPTPAANNMIAWTSDPLVAPLSASTGAAGTLYLNAVYVAAPATTTQVWLAISATGAGAVSGQSSIGLYDSSGTLVTSAPADALVTKTGVLSLTWSKAVTITPGMYWVAVLFNATTMPQVYRSSGTLAQAMNANLSAANLRTCINGTGLTALPTSITVAANSQTAQQAYWLALS